MTDQECIDFAADELVKMGIIASKNDIQDSHRERVKRHILLISIPGIRSMIW